METCFADKLATGRFAMGSNEPLGQPIEVECPGKPIDLESGETTGEGFVEAQAPFDFGVQGTDATTPSPSSGSNKKRKRASMMSDEDTIQVNNMSLMHCGLWLVLSITHAMLKHTQICAKLLWTFLVLKWIKSWLF
jgi:hypothetical protein